MDENNSPEDKEKQNEETQQPAEQQESINDTTGSLDEDLKQQDEQSKTPEPTKAKPSVIPQQGGHKKRKWPWVVILILLIGGAAAYWFFVKDKSTTTDQPSNTSTQQSQTTQTNTYTPNTVAYAFKASDSEPYVIYTRSAGGGDRTEAKKLAKDEMPTYSDVNGPNVVFATEKDIYVSTDNSKSYTKIITGSGSSQITSLKFSTDGSRIVYGSLPGAGGKNTAKSINLQGQDSKDLFTSSKAGVFIIAWDDGKQKIIYREGCYNCDGVAELPVLRDLKTDKISNLLTGLTASELAGLAVSSDFSTLVYAKSTENAAATQDIGTFTGAPYTINTFDLTTNKTTQITSFGAKGEKNSNGTYKTRVVHVGFVAGTKTPYYSADMQLYTAKSGTPSLTYEATKNILYIPFVGSNIIIAGAGSDTADYTLSNYSISSKKSTTIFQGDNNTIIFGVTTK